MAYQKPGFNKMKLSDSDINTFKKTRVSNTDKVATLIRREELEKKRYKRNKLNLLIIKELNDGRSVEQIYNRIKSVYKYVTGGTDPLNVIKYYEKKYNEAEINKNSEDLDR